MPRRRWTTILAMLLLTQWAAAFGHCRVMADMLAQLADVPICAAMPDMPADHAPDHDKAFADQDCPACHQVPCLPQSLVPQDFVVLSWVEAQIAPDVAPAALPPTRAPPYRAHAPPSA